MKMIERLKEIGVDEVACLIDFGVEVDSVLESLDHLVVLQDLSNAQQPEANLLATTAAHSWLGGKIRVYTCNQRVLHWTRHDH